MTPPIMRVLTAISSQPHRVSIAPMPIPAPAAAPPRMDLAPSSALSIAANPPSSFKGRVLSVLVSDGFDGKLLMDLRKAVAEAKGLVKLIGPRIGGVRCSKHNLHPVDHRIGGAPSVLFDAITLIPGTDSLSLTKAARSTVTDAFQHRKYFGWAESAKLMLNELGLIREAKDPDNRDPALCALTNITSAEAFVQACKSLRHWPREALFKP